MSPIGFRTIEMLEQKALEDFSDIYPLKHLRSRNIRTTFAIET